jgi:hypothetical protein
VICSRPPEAIAPRPFSPPHQTPGKFGTGLFSGSGAALLGNVLTFGPLWGCKTNTAEDEKGEIACRRRSSRSCEKGIEGEAGATKKGIIEKITEAVGGGEMEEMHPPKYKTLEDSAAKCVVTGNDCLRHCYGMFSMKDTSMARLEHFSHPGKWPQPLTQ